MPVAVAFTIQVIVVLFLIVVVVLCVALGVVPLIRETRNTRRDKH